MPVDPLCLRLQNLTGDEFVRVANAIIARAGYEDAHADALARVKASRPERVVYQIRRNKRAPRPCI